MELGIVRTKNEIGNQLDNKSKAPDQLTLNPDVLEIGDSFVARFILSVVFRQIRCIFVLKKTSHVTEHHDNENT